MRIWNGIDAFDGRGGPSVATIGNYDGVHLGHQAIVRSVVRDARARSRPALLLTFEPHPLTVVAPDRRPRLLQTRRQKLDVLESLGLDEVLLVRFTPQLAERDGEAFLQDVLSPVRFAALHIGENFRFGKGRSGDLELLTAVGERHGFAVHGIPPVRVDGETVSSTLIRGAVEAGDVERARAMLGRPFALGGEVVHGSGRGRDLDFPTANLDVENEIVPRSGVYVTEFRAVAARHRAITNVGMRPTFDGRTLTVESHLLDFSDDLYAQRVEVRFLVRLRDEMRFPNPVALGDQIARDIAAAASYFDHMQLRFG